MDHHKLLYKGNRSVFSPKDNKRKIAHQIRADKRNELYSSKRYMSLTPSPKNNKNLPEVLKENVKPLLSKAPANPKQALSSKEAENGTNIASTNVEEKISRQKNHLMRYLAWKAEKNRQAQSKEQHERVPFVVPTKSVFEPPNFKKSFAPRNHTFNPPSNLKDLKVEVLGVNSIRCINGTEPATYHFVETPKKTNHLRGKPMQAKSTQAKKPPISQPLIPKTQTAKTPSHVSRTNSKPIACPLTESKPKIPPPNVRKTVPKPISKNTVAQKLQQKSEKKAEIKPPVQTIPSVKPIEKTQRTMPLKISKTSQKPSETNRQPQVSTVTDVKIVKSNLPPLKRPAFKAKNIQKKTASISSAAVLALPRNTRSKTADALGAKLRTKTLLHSQVGICDKIPETPTETIVNSFMNCVTSTKRKSSSGKELNVKSMFGDVVNAISHIDNFGSDSVLKPKINEKLNFVRYSFVKSDKDNPTKKNEETENATCNLENDAHGNVKATPDKNTAPTTYMSPYVSVARGKVSTKIEREKRNSIYMGADDSVAVSPDKTAVVRHTLATVRYYRKQLMDEIARLNDQCYSWERYKESNTQLIQDCGADMIVVTVGQTRLLTSKKLQQFSGLIDRCEEGVLSKVPTSCDGSEGTKPILPEDLEGFWSMVGLQIENVDKRFAELERWRANNWSDPDDIVPKATKNLANVKKTKKRKPVTTARPNSALQKMLKTAHAAYLNKKATGTADEDVILTPSQTRQVLIRDRRSRSAAATVITVNTPRTNRKSIDQNETPKLLPSINGFRKSLHLFKNALLGKPERELEQKENCSPLRQNLTSRKSILKTPGSVCKPKTVIFNSPPLKFTIDDSGEELSKNDHDEQQRIYRLRNRRIVLRDSSEFEVPK